MPSPTAPLRFWPIMAVVVVGGAFCAGVIAGRRQASDRAAGIEKSQESGENLGAMVAKDKPAASPRVINWDGTGAGLLKLVHPVNAIHSRQQLLAALAGCSDGTLDELWKAWPQQGGGAAARILVSECFGRELARRHGESVLDDWVAQKPASEASAWIKGAFTSLAAASPDTVVAALERLPAQYRDGDSGLTPQRTAWLAVLSQLKPPDGKAVTAAVALVKGRGTIAKKTMWEWMLDDGVWADPAGVRAWGLANKDSYVLRGAYTSMARRDPAAAVAAWQADGPGSDSGPNSDSDYRSNAAPIAAAWSRQDASAALTWANSLVGEGRQQALEETLKELAFTDPVATAARLVGLEGVGPNTYKAITSEWLLRDPAAAKEWILGLPKEAMSWAAGEYVTSGSGIALGHAMELVSRLPVSVNVTADGRLKRLAQTAAHQDPASALTWARALPIELQLATTGEILNIWAENDPPAVLQALVSLPDVVAQSAAMMVGRTMSQPAFANWAESLPVGLQRSAWEGQLKRLRENDPLGMISTAFALGPKAALFESDPPEYLISTMVDHDGPSGMDWVAEMFTGTSLERAMEKAVRAWGDYDLESLEEWIERQPESPVKAAAEAAFKSTLGEEAR